MYLYVKALHIIFIVTWFSGLFYVVRLFVYNSEAMMKEDRFSINACAHLNHEETDICTAIERDFLKALLGGCSVPIGALATIHQGQIDFTGNILSPDGSEKEEVNIQSSIDNWNKLGINAASMISNSKKGRSIIQLLRNG